MTTHNCNLNLLQLFTSVLRQKFGKKHIRNQKFIPVKISITMDWDDPSDDEEDVKDDEPILFRHDTDFLIADEDEDEDDDDFFPMILDPIIEDFIDNLVPKQIKDDPPDIISPVETVRRMPCGPPPKMNRSVSVATQIIPPIVKLPEPQKPPKMKMRFGKPRVPSFKKRSSRSPSPARREPVPLPAHLSHLRHEYLVETKLQS